MAMSVKILKDSRTAQLIPSHKADVHHLEVCTLLPFVLSMCEQLRIGLSSKYLATMATICSSSWFPHYIVYNNTHLSIHLF